MIFMDLALICTGFLRTHRLNAHQLTFPILKQMFVPRPYIAVCRALARILKLPVILEKVPVKKVDAAGENQVECAVAHKPSRMGSRGPP